ncbi:MAG: 16S rRNA (cytosine(967)-C(5))-methyltransferase RsmB [Lachnospiraceae bacterium]|nr:16S rRNA (cytosine(967)-C(5))-methyltransferase RsmB [Lachnospiraceae bacterium]
MNSRALAASIIDKTLEQGGKSHELLREAFRTDPAPDLRERSFITALVHGTVGTVLTLDFYLAQVSKTPPAGLKPYLRSVLRMGLFQLLYMDRIPASAAVNESVKLIRKRFGEGLTAYTNGVLRSAARKTDWIRPEGAAALSLPQPLYDALTALYGAERTRQIAACFLEAPPLWGRVNESRIRPEEAVRLLERDGFSAVPHPLFAASLTLERRREDPEETERLPLEQTEAIRNGFVQLQDLSAQLAVLAAAPQPGMKVLDLCAAPGGKSLHAADLMKDRGEVIACDLTASKCRLIRENAERSGFSCLSVRQADATVFHPAFENTFDLVIADLPCSGLGTASRKPEIKYRVTREKVEELAALQRQILRNAMRYVKPGGKLLYSTCTLTKEENADNALYIEKELGFAPSALALPAEIPGIRSGCHSLQLLPGDRPDRSFGYDGFFISLFAKEKNA